jgi:hypothetical protein
VAAAQVLNDGRSRRAIAAGLAGQGFVTPSGAHYSATSIKRMLGEGGSKSRALTHYDAKGAAFFGGIGPYQVQKRPRACQSRKMLA